MPKAQETLVIANGIHSLVTVVAASLWAASNH